MRQLQVRGCLPALLLLLVITALVVLVISASLAVVVPVAAALLLLGLARSLWYRLTGRSPPSPFQGATFRTFRIDQRWQGGGPAREDRDEGPVVDALPRPPRPPGSGPDGG
jgi:hypothetical protein